MSSLLKKPGDRVVRRTLLSALPSQKAESDDGQECPPYLINRLLREVDWDKEQDNDEDEAIPGAAMPGYLRRSVDFSDASCTSGDSRYCPNPLSPGVVSHP